MGTVNLVWTVRGSASRSFALARSARTRRRIPFDERPLSEHEALGNALAETPPVLAFRPRP